MRCLVTYALRRSGQHAIINWICRQSGYNIHLNNVDILSYDGNLRVANYIIYKHGIPVVSKYDRYKKVRFDALGFPDLRDFDLCVMSFEDAFPQTIDYIYRRAGYLPKEVTTSVIIRDPYNLFASRLQTYGGLWKPHREEKAYTIQGMWNNHATICLTPNKYMMPLIPIKFNNWVSDQCYRKDLAEKLNLEFTDRGIYEVPLHGTSSFSDSDVLNRWKIKSKEVKALIDKETAYKSQQLFGDII